MQRMWYKQGEALLQEMDSTRPFEHELAIWYLGQCGFVFKSSEATVYIDPVLNGMPDKTGRERRVYPIPFKPAAVRADYLICTHGHSDHLAMQTVTAAAAADPHLKLIVP
ncbi:MAG: MBL fold metallo-hydrolase, partial [Butyricicoccaceae bacterium]